MLVFLSTVFLAAFQSYKGVTATDEGLLRYFKASGASYQFLLRHVVLPSALEWIFAACRLNIGFAILGAFVGEFIASTHGLGHYILRASGLYRVDEVLAGVLVLSVMSLALSLAVRALERHIIRWRPAIG
jgi:NitT/TauT family transport system permease protein